MMTGTKKSFGRLIFDCIMKKAGVIRRLSHFSFDSWDDRGANPVNCEMRYKVFHIESL